MSSKPVAVVTGGAGFIGSHMVDNLLAHGYRVRAVDNLVSGRESNIAHLSADTNFSFEQVDIRNIHPGHAVFKDVRQVIHFAGIGDIVPSIERPMEYLSVNVQGTVHVLECARHARVQKLVYAASSSCYGLAEVPTREDHPLMPEHPYALSKYMGEQACFHWHKVYGLPVNTIRIFNAYGTRVRTTGAYGAVFGVFFKQKLAGKPYTVVGDGSQKRDFLYVTDVAEAFRLASESEKTGETWNLGAGNPQTVNRLIALLGGERVYIPKRPGEPDCTWADISKISRDLCWKQQIPFEEGVARMMTEIDVWRDAPLWDPKSIEHATKTWFQYLGKAQ